MKTELAKFIECLSELESKRFNLDIEMSAWNRAKRCNGNVPTISAEYSSLEDDDDELDGCAPSSTEAWSDVEDDLQFTKKYHLTRMPCKPSNVLGYLDKLNGLLSKRRKLQNVIDTKRSLHHLENGEEEIETLDKRLRACARKKTTFSKDILKDHFKSMETVLQKRIQLGVKCEKSLQRKEGTKKNKLTALLAAVKLEHSAGKRIRLIEML